MPPWPLRRVAVRGASMRPALHPGDFLLVWTWPHPRPRPGAVVLVALPDRPLSVKRLHAWTAGGGVWVQGDNDAASTDSRTLGPLPPGSLRGRVLCRYWPLRRSA